MDIYEVEVSLEKLLLYKRVTLEEIKDILGVVVELGGNDLDAVNIADYNLMCEYKGFDVDVYVLIDRHGQYYITEIGVNNM